jgi:hypothetical protein
MRKTVASRICFIPGILFAVLLLLFIGTQEASPREEIGGNAVVNRANTDIVPSGTVKVVFAEVMGRDQRLAKHEHELAKLRKRPVTADYNDVISSDFTYQDIVQSGRMSSSSAIRQGAYNNIRR